MRALHRSQQAGIALISTVLVVAILAGMTSAFLAIGVSGNREVMGVRDDARALYLAEAGIQEALTDIRMKVEANQGGKANYPNLNLTAGIATKGTPKTLKSGSYWASVTDQGDDIYTLEATGTSGSGTRALRVAVRIGSSGAFDNALFAGNISNDPNYTMKLGGSGSQADVIIGDIYSGGALSVSGDASFSGTTSVNSWISGAAGTTGITQDIPDVFAMGYETNHDIDVASEFTGGSQTYLYDAAGGKAWQLPEDNPAHIFRKNPSDRSSLTSATVKDDFFLEDPYEPVNRDSNQDGSDPYPITLTGTAGDPGVDSSNYVFSVDGNFWVNNSPTFSFRFNHEADEAVRVTFVVKGNVYFSDNLFYQDQDTDAIAFIAINDPDVADSGNIYFGDRNGGTLSYMSAFMYAENDFVDYNLSASGSKQVEVFGAMSAGNHVNIERDYAGHHSRLTVDFDDRLKNGLIELPGMPKQISSSTGVSVIGWSEEAH